MEVQKYKLLSFLLCPCSLLSCLAFACALYTENTCKTPHTSSGPCIGSLCLAKGLVFLALLWHSPSRRSAALLLGCHIHRKVKDVSCNPCKGGPSERRRSQAVGPAEKLPVVKWEALLPKVQVDWCTYSWLVSTLKKQTNKKPNQKKTPFNVNAWMLFPNEEIGNQEVTAALVLSHCYVQGPATWHLDQCQWLFQCNACGIRSLRALICQMLSDWWELLYLVNGFEVNVPYLGITKCFSAFNWSHFSGICSQGWISEWRLCGDSCSTQVKFTCTHYLLWCLFS